MTRVVVGRERRSSSPDPSDRGEHAVERPRHSAEVQSVDEQAAVLDLPSAAGAQEAAELLLDCPSLLRRLMLEGTARRAKSGCGN